MLFLLLAAGMVVARVENRIQQHIGAGSLLVMLLMAAAAAELQISEWHLMV